jgi:hypothetical protein
MHHPGSGPRRGRPHELPVESPDAVGRHVNLPVARQRGLTIPPALLALAHRTVAWEAASRTPGASDPRR